MGLSSNVLWHQTKIDGLKGIIKEKGFFYSYSLEKIIAAEVEVEAAFPMVSFCDLPFSEIGDYLKKYGGYSIGLSREWGQRNSFSIVWYCEPSSEVLNMQIKRFVEINDLIEKDKESKDYQRFLYLFAHIKNYEGELPSRHYKKYRFHDEREIRIVPIFENLTQNNYQPYLAKEYYEDFKEKNGSSLLSPTMKLSFEWEDIKYIIVENEANIDDIKKLIQKQSGREDLRINYFTNQQVREDILGNNHNMTIALPSLNLSDFKSSVAKPRITDIDEGIKRMKKLNGK